MGHSQVRIAAPLAVLTLCSGVARGQADACAAPVAGVSDASLHLALDDPEPAVASDAAEAFQHYGSPGA
jgi:hypothetical protein